VRRDNWRRYAAPAAFLIAATIAIVLIRNGIEAGKPPARLTTTVGTPHAVKRYWTVKAGETFALISSKTGVPVARLRRLNPKVKSTSLFIGQRIRIK